MLREQPRVQALLAGPGGARYVINTSRSIYSACIGAWCQVQFRSKRTIQTRPFPNRALQHTKDDNNLSQGYGPFGFTKNLQQHSKVGRAGTKIISTLEAKKPRLREVTHLAQGHTALVRIKAGIISEQETNSILRWLSEEGSMKDFFKELGAQRRELTVD